MHLLVISKVQSHKIRDAVYRLDVTKTFHLSNIPFNSAR